MSVNRSAAPTGSLSLSVSAHKSDRALLFGLYGAFFTHSAFARLYIIVFMIYIYVLARIRSGRRAICLTRLIHFLRGRFQFLN
jgi:hypothetical protein